MRVLMVITSDDYYRDESNHYLLLPEEVHTSDEGLSWFNSHLDDLQLKHCPGTISNYDSKVHHRYDTDGQWHGPANYDVDFIELDDFNKPWDEFATLWKKQHPSNPPEE